MHVDQIRDRMKGEERDAERQRETRQREAGAAGSTPLSVPIDEVGIFEHAEQREVRRDGDARSPANAGRPRSRRSSARRHN